MAELYTIDGAHITTVRDGTVELTQVAETGAEGTGTMVLDDTAGTTSVVGHKSVTVRQDSCANTRTFDGFVDDREYDRDGGIGRAPHVGAARAITVQVIDLNNLLSQKGMLGTDCKRPAETCQARFDWLVASNDWPAVTIGSRVSIPSGKGMTKSDYRFQHPGDVINDIATAAGGLNYYVADWGSGAELTLRNDNTSTADSSAVRISNVSTDVDSDHSTLGANKTFFPSSDFKLNRSPREVYSKMSLSYGKGTQTAERAATATAFNGPRYGTATNSNIKTAAKADDALSDLLWIHSTERDFLEGSIQVPASAVNLLRQGERLQVKFQHLATEGYGSFTWCRVMERTVKPLNAEGAIYELRLRLSPQEAAAPAATIVQSAFGGAGDGGANLSLPNPVTVGNLLIFCSSDRSGENPGAPNTSASSPRWGAGAWTLLNVSEVSSMDTGSSDGIAFWGKVADSTDATGRITNSNSQNGIWEIACPNAAATLAAITTVEKHDQMNSLQTSQTLTTGSLGTLASGSLAMYCTNWGDQTNGGAGETRALATLAAGWTQRLYEPAYYGGGVITEHTPYTVIADAVGSGATVTAAVTRSKLNRSFDGLHWGEWCGMAVIVTPQ